MASWSTLQELVARVEARAQASVGDHAVAEADAQNAVEAALMRLSVLRPRTATKAYSGDGATQSFSLVSLEPAWVDGFSSVRRVEHPTGNYPPTYLDANDYDLYPDATTATAVILTAAPATGTNNVKLFYTVPHTASNTTTSVPDGPQRLAAEYLGLCALAEMYGARYGHSADSQFAADQVENQSKTDVWLRIAERACGQANEALGLGGAQAGAGAAGALPVAGAWADPDPTSGVYGDPVWRSRTRR